MGCILRLCACPTVGTRPFSLVLSSLGMNLGFYYPLQHWSKLDTTSGPSPPTRFRHAACCIAGPLTGQEHPLLLVGGGFDGGVLRDMWVLDIDRCVWSEVSDLTAQCEVCTCTDFFNYGLVVLIIQRDNLPEAMLSRPAPGPLI